MVNRIPVSIEDLRAMRDAIWTDMDPRYPSLHLWRNFDGKLTKQGNRRFRRIFRAAAITGYNFTVKRYEFGSFANAVCNDCGHTLSFNDQTASWARKHRAKHLGVHDFQVENKGHDLMKEDTNGTQ